MSQLKTPVALFVFNRPELTARIFQAVSEQKPSQLLVVADGPRSDRPEEAELCEASRLATEQVDWPCDVMRNYADANIGCRGRMSSGIDWVFENVDEAILLEDDCLPHPSFFPFCSAMLARYRSEERVAMVGGSQLLPRVPINTSYYFSRYAHVWGWATWKRAWSGYDVEMEEWSALSSAGWLKQIFGQSPATDHWAWLFDQTSAGKIDTWDYQWLFSCWKRDALCILPRMNLVTNLGFGPDATNTIKSDGTDSLPYEAMDFPLVHPEEMVRNERIDSLESSRVFGAPEGGLADQLRWRVRRRAATLPQSVRRAVHRLLQQ